MKLNGQYGKCGECGSNEHYKTGSFSSQVALCVDCAKKFVSMFDENEKRVKIGDDANCEILEYKSKEYISVGGMQSDGSLKESRYYFKDGDWNKHKGKGK